MFARRLVSVLKQRVFTVDDATEIQISRSVGVAVPPVGAGSDSSRESAVEVADFAMYAVKEQGRDDWAALGPQVLRELLASGTSVIGTLQQ